MAKVIFITGNKGKFEEAKSIIPDLEQLDLDLVEVQGIDPAEIIKHKLVEARPKVEGNIIVEDVSLVFNALNGLPGPLIKWFLKTLGNDGLYRLAGKFNNFDAVLKVTIGLSN